MKLIKICLLCSLFFSCTTNSLIEVRDNSESAFYFETEAMPAVSSIIRSFTGVDGSVAIFDKAEIEKSFLAAGIAVDSISASGSTSISFTGFTQDINNLVPAGSQPISLRDTASGKELEVVFNEKTMGSLFSLLGEDALLYIELLQAPLFTGEEMTAEEYLDFIGALYGADVLSEMRDSTLQFEIKTPQEIEKAFIEPSTLGEVSISGEKAVFTLSLYKFLSNNNDIFFRIQWKN